MLHLQLNSSECMCDSVYESKKHCFHQYPQVETTCVSLYTLTLPIQRAIVAGTKTRKEKSGRENSSLPHTMVPRARTAVLAHALFDECSHTHESVPLTCIQ